MSIEYPVKPANCVDYVLANRLSTDTIHHGKYTPVTATNHLWIERDGECYDNMNPKGFKCDSELYKSAEIWDLNQPLKVLRMIGKRPNKYEGV